MQLKLGCNLYLNTLQNAHRMRITSDYLDALGPPPPNSQNWPSAVEAMIDPATGKPYEFNGWGMDGNDTAGDCTIADCCHQLMLWTANGSGQIVVPTTAQAIAVYSALTGYDGTPATDHGADVDTVAQYMKSTGMLGHKIDGWGNVDPAVTPFVKWGIEIFGTVKMAFVVPDFAEPDFEAGIPWDYTGQPYKIEGGHDTPLVMYQSDGTDVMWEVITWGRRQKMTSRFFNHFVMAVVAPVSHDFVKSTGLAPSGYGLTQMLNRLNQVEQSVGTLVTPQSLSRI